jgi:hypothetical protein
MKKRVLTDIKIICDEPSYLGRWCRTQEERLKEIEAWVKDFHAFIRDHRSQDPVFLNVARAYEDQCGFCGSKWEEDEEGMPLCCGRATEEYAAHIIAISSRG